MTHYRKARLCCLSLKSVEFGRFSRKPECPECAAVPPPWLNWNSDVLQPRAASGICSALRSAPGALLRPMESHRGWCVCSSVLRQEWLRNPRADFRGQPRCIIASFLVLCPISCSFTAVAQNSDVYISAQGDHRARLRLQFCVIESGKCPRQKAGVKVAHACAASCFVPEKSRVRSFTRFIDVTQGGWAGTSYFIMAIKGSLLFGYSGGKHLICV